MRIPGRAVATVDPGQPDFPPTSGQITGWLGVGLGLAGLVWAATSFHSFGGVRFALGLGVLVLGSYAFLLRPRIRVRTGVLHLVNPLEVVTIPLGLISRVTVRSATHVFVGRGDDQRRYVGVAVGRPLRTLRRNDRSEVPTLQQAAMDQPTHPRTSVPTADLLEEWVGDLVTDARRTGAAGQGEVERRPVWWIAAPLAVLTVAFVVSLFL